MLFKQVNLHIKNDEGSGLVLALMTLLVLSVLGASLGAVTVGSFKLGDVNRDDTSAYYIAEAGANMAYEEMKTGVLEVYEKNLLEGSFFESQEGVEGVKDTTSGNVYTFDEQFGDQPSATITVEEVSGSNPRNYMITSIGKVDGKTRTVSKAVEVSWVDNDTGPQLPLLPENGSLLGFSSIKLGNQELIGKVYTNSTKNNSITLDWGDWKETTIVYPEGVNVDKIIKTPKNFENNMPKLESENFSFNYEMYNTIINDFPTFDIDRTLEDKTISDEGGYNNHKIHNNGNLYMNHYLADGYELDLNSDVYIPKVEFSQNNKMKINTNNKDITIVIDDLYLDSENIEIVGNGSVTFYITKFMRFSSSFGSINRNGNPNQFKLFYAGNSQLKFDGLGLLNGHVFVKRANVKADSTKFNGYFLSGGNHLSFDSGSPFSKMYIIAPNGDVSLDSGYGIQGSVIADKFEMSNGSRLIYDPLNDFDFPFGSSGTSIEPSIGDIISTEPAVEPN